MAIADGLESNLRPKYDGSVLVVSITKSTNSMTRFPTKVEKPQKMTEIDNFDPISQRSGFSKKSDHARNEKKTNERILRKTPDRLGQTDRAPTYSTDRQTENRPIAPTDRQSTDP